MNDKNKRLALLGSFVLSLAIVGVSFASAKGIDDSFIVKADPISYSLSLNSGNAVNGDGVLNLVTTKSNTLKLSYFGVSTSAGHFGVLEEGGQLFNAYDNAVTYRNAIGRITSLTATFSGNLSIDYSWGGEIASDVYIRNGFALTSGTPFTFNNEEPNYFRITANEDTTITSISVSYTCGTNETYPSGFKGIKNETELKALRDLVNSGNNLSGVVVYVTEDFALANADFGDPIGNSDTITFSGTFDGLGHTITGFTKTTGSAIGLFSRVTKGTVKNVKLAGVSVAGSGQRAAGLVARAVDATIENCEIVSGSVSGTTQNGGVVGVVVAGTSKTIIDRCINRATITSTAGRAGGVVGYVHSGTVEVKNCINFANVTASSSNPAGGVLGGNSGTATVNHCYNSPDAVVKNASNTASNVNASSLGWVYVASSSLGSDNGQCNTVIENASDLRVFLADGTVMSGENVILSHDIDLNDVVNNDNTDYSRNATFKGKFDGLGHTISNFKSKAATTALFKGVTTATVMNFKMKNVKVEATTQRATSVVSRFEKSTMKDVEILSGTITGVQENGGLIGSLVGTSNVIDNCVNNASVSGTGQKNGGIVGYNATVATAFEMRNCINRGTVTGGDITTGGIMGATIPSGTGLVNIHDCVNYGNVNGTSYVGGIIGLARENTNGSCVIRDCSNYGHITGSSTVSVGGIAGLARFNVTDCVCYGKANISLNGNTSQASALSEVGGVVDGTNGGGAHRGSIVGTTGNSATATGSIDSDRISSFEDSVANGNTSINQAYGRIQTLGNGRTILTMANRFSISSREGIGNYETLINRDTAINKGGFGPEYIPNHPEEATYKLWLANMEPLMLPDGRLFIFYRTDNKETSTPGVYYSSIRAIESRDNGQTWLNTRHIIFENYSNDCYGDGNIRGAYEPFAVLDGNTLQVFIAFDAGATRAGGLGPNNSSFICTNYYQNLLRIPVDISNMGFNVGSTYMAIQGTSSYQRPGMPSVVKLNDGTYAMILEHNGSAYDYANYAMRVAISYSTDLVTWTTPKVIITPEHSGIAYGDTRYLCGAPYIQMLPDGRIAVSYTTNDYFVGDANVRSGFAPDYFKTVELAISNDPVTYNSTPVMVRKPTVAYATNCGARYGGCAVIGNKIILIVNEYEHQVIETYDAELDEYNYSYNRVVKRGTVFSTSTYYC